MPHAHECPLCEAKYSCSKYGCEEYPLNVCDECMEGIDESAPVEVGGEG